VSRIALVLIFAAGAAHGAEFRSVQDNAAVLYDAPSRASKPVFVVQRHYPLEIIITLDPWIKVRDHTGALSWIERKSLSEKRMVMVSDASAEVRQRPDEGAPLAFSAAQSVVLELVEVAPNGWLRVRHADGAAGFVRAAQVWGD